MPAAKKSQTAAESKKDKLQRQQAKNREFVLTPKDYRDRVTEPLVRQVNKLLLLALALGNSANAGEGSQAEKVDKVVDTIRKRFNAFRDDHVKKVRRLNTYYATLYRVAGKRAERAASGQPPKTRESIMHRSVATFQPALYNFIREASGSNEALLTAADCSTFDKSSPLFGYMSPTYAAQFILAYVAANRRFDENNGQYIKPDDLMKKHLSEGIAKVLAGIAQDARPKEVERAKKFPGEFTFCKLQELICFYRVRHPEGTAPAAALATVRKDQSNWPTLLAEFDSISKVREQAYVRLHDSKPKVERAPGPKGPRGPLTEAQKHARRIKREANAAASALGYDLNFVEKTPKVAAAA